MTFQQHQPLHPSSQQEFPDENFSLTNRGRIMALERDHRTNIEQLSNLQQQLAFVIHSLDQLKRDMSRETSKQCQEDTRRNDALPQPHRRLSSKIIRPYEREEETYRDHLLAQERGYRRTSLRSKILQLPSWQIKSEIVKPQEHKEETSREQLPSQGRRSLQASMGSRKETSSNYNHPLANQPTENNNEDIMAKGPSSNSEEDQATSTDSEGDAEGVYSLEHVTEGAITFNIERAATKPTTMRLMATIGEKDALVLVDNEATHNYINNKFDEKLKLTPKSIVPFEVKVANGQKLLCSQVIKAAKLKIQGVDIKAELHVLVLAGLDIVLGNVWLKSVGRIIHDYSAMTMHFNWNSKQHTWKAMAPTTKHHCMDNTIEKFSDKRAHCYSMHYLEDKVTLQERGIVENLSRQEGIVRKWARQALQRPAIQRARKPIERLALSAKAREFCSKWSSSDSRTSPTIEFDSKPEFDVH